MGNTVFSKIFTAVISMVLIIFAVLTLAVYSFLGNYATREKEETMTSAGERIAEMTNMIASENFSNAAQYFQLSIDLIARNINCNIYLAEPDGRIVFYSALKNNVMRKMPERIANELNKGNRAKEIGKLPALSREDVLIIALPVKKNDTVIGGVYLINEVPELSGLRNDIFRVFLVAGFLALLIGAVVAFYISKKITTPISAIAKAAEAISLGDMSTRVRVFKDDEVGKLASSFNIMADSIAKQDSAKSSFISDVSHELRTPMTSITGFVEGILDNTIPKESQDIYLKIVLDESKRLSKLVTELLDISRLESDESKLELSIFDINELIRLSIIGFENRFDEKNIIVDADFEEESQLVTAEKDSIKRVITNLLDNAIKFCNENGTIFIKSFSKGNKVYVSVKNTGDGIPKEKMETVFNRFYKLDKSRSMNKNGVGLGLYIVKTIISKHMQTINVDSVEGEYAMFTFTLQKSK
ncbi:MAG: HAMP domain-containing protein [Clostridia bacterium]|nr:HAMP domain-containing protein [Clostridia bacterium]